MYTEEFSHNMPIFPLPLRSSRRDSRRIATNQHLPETKYGNRTKPSSEIENLRFCAEPASLTYVLHDIIAPTVDQNTSDVLLPEHDCDNTLYGQEKPHQPIPGNPVTESSKYRVETSESRGCQTPSIDTVIENFSYRTARTKATSVFSVKGI